MANIYTHAGHVGLIHTHTYCGRDEKDEELTDKNVMKEKHRLSGVKALVLGFIYFFLNISTGPLLKDL